eukprot:TRINITY_DN5334_c0_g1_i1.p1 TRINITY_DN5334_c0_g1~~TRINITY_DN5334_c0_g1_i1.p1  ORF type:complete len:707 (+),score=158.92 TRINITY_DN5334_c0_g1_i1:68-2188(+)
MGGDKALQQLQALPYTFSPGVLKHHRVRTLRRLLAALGAEADDLAAFLRTGEPRGSCSRLGRAALLALAAEWQLPPVRFGGALPGAAQAEAEAASKARVFAEAAVQALTTADDPAARQAALSVAAEAALLCGDGAACAALAARMDPEPPAAAPGGAERLGAMLRAGRLCNRATQAGFDPGDLPPDALARWCELLRAALVAGPGCDDVAALWRQGFGGALRRAASRAGVPPWRVAASPLGAAVLSRCVLHGEDCFVREARQGVHAELAAALRGGEPPAAAALFAAAAVAGQGLLRGWVLPDDHAEGGGPGGCCVGDDPCAALARAMYNPPPPGDLALLRGADWAAHPRGDLGSGALRAEPDALPAALTELASWCELLTRGPPTGCEPPALPGGIAEEVVQQFYDENPYPVWRGVGTAGLPTFPTHRAYLDAFLPPTVAATLSAGAAEGQERILVAGCGSGHQVALALETYTESHVTGVDLSRVALGYARAALEAEPRWAARWQLFQGDLSRITGDCFPQQFDAVECCGVLHHCQSPQAALQALLACLRPGGVLTLGVYAASPAEPIRDAIAQLRERARVPEGRQPSLAEVREAREDVLSLPRSSRLRQTLEGQMAFAATAPLRDMVFHPCAHYFSVEDLRKLCDACGLELLGFQFNSHEHDVAARMSYAQSAPEDGEMRDWRVWARLESDGRLRRLGPWHELLLLKR